ncbi:MAG: FAD-dependent oxidoreductase [Acidobacteria bacterium]|nr:FAD-dependent oxidoreductase [Acidobacteriota bacterium]
MSDVRARGTPPSERSYDVVVYGGTAGGAMAAIAAAREGARVALLEPRRHVGGMVSGGLGRTDFDNQIEVIGGMAREFFVRVGRHYGEPMSWTFEPHVAEGIFNDWLKDAGVDVFLEHRLDTVDKQDARIVSIAMENGTAFAAKVYVDATYEGDLMARAGVSYTVGREGRDQYGESLAGVRAEGPFGGKQFRVPVRAHDEAGMLLPLLNPFDPSEPGTGDRKVQAYNFRLCLTDRRDNQVSIEHPPNYKPEKYELLRRYIAAFEEAGMPFSLRNILGISRMPNDKTDVNDAGGFSTNYVGMNWQYPEADYKRREEIREEHVEFTKGLLYFLGHDAQVPEHIREEMKRYGLAKDEFADTGHWPHQLYVREARRMIGEQVLTQADLQTRRTKYDSIGMGGYNIDSMPVQRVPYYVQKFPKPYYAAVNEGYLTVPVEPYQVPYRAILPKHHECANLLVPVCLSASHVAYSSIRMEPQYMILGHSAGVAAALAARDDVPVHHLDVAKLTQRLHEQNQILSLDGNE